MALIKPEVYSQLVREKINGKVKILQLAKNIGEIEEFREVGETIHFPAWKYVGDAETLASKGTITTAELDQVDSTATVTHIAKGITVFDRSNLTAIGDQIQEGAEQLAISIARKLDSDLITEIVENVVMKKTIAEKDRVTESELFDVLQLFGDENDSELFNGIVIHSKFMKSFYGMESFVSATNTMSADGNGIPTKNGFFGYFRGIPVFVADKGTWDFTKGEGVIYVIQDGALGYKIKRDLLIEEQRDASKKKTDIYADLLFAVKLLDPSKIAIARFTIA